MILLLMLLSFVSFTIIKLPPGNYLTSYIADLRQSGAEVDQAMITNLEKRYGLNQPFFVQYWKWVSGFIHGDFGQSFLYREPIINLLSERLPFTVIISLCTFLFQYLMAIPIGIYSAVKQYSPFDYLLTFIGFIGLSVPNFLLALILMFIGFKYFGVDVSGLFSPEYMGEPWSWGKFLNMLTHLWVPIVVVGTAGTAGLIRVMRGQMLDELGKAYMQTARAKGLREWWVILKYPTRVAINPILSTAGWMLPLIFSGATISGIVLGLPTIGPVLLRALTSQDMYLAGTIIMIQSSLVVVGTLVSDLLLAIVDPRIRYET